MVNEIPVNLVPQAVQDALSALKTATTVDQVKAIATAPFGGQNEMFKELKEKVLGGKPIKSLQPSVAGGWRRDRRHGVVKQWTHPTASSPKIPQEHILTSKKNANTSTMRNLAYASVTRRAAQEHLFSGFNGESGMYFSKPYLALKKINMGRLKFHGR